MQNQPVRLYDDSTIIAIIYGLAQTCIMMALGTQCDTYWDIRHDVKRTDISVRRYLCAENMEEATVRPNGLLSGDLHTQTSPP
jgi:hypothetical protein